MGEPAACAAVRVLYNFDYSTKDGRLVSIRQAEKLQLLKCTNNDWWQVRRDQDSKPFYVPAAYVRQIPPPFIPQPKHEYTNMPAPAGCCHQERRTLNSVLRNELITGNYNLRESGNPGDKRPDKNHRSEMTPVRRNYSVVAPAGPKKPVPCPRSVRQLSKSLETLAEEIQFQPTAALWKVEQTSDYNTPSPDYLDSSEDMFWKKGSSGTGESSSVQRSSSFKYHVFGKGRVQKQLQQPAEDSSDSVASRSLESLVDSGAEACSSSSYEWDRTPEDHAHENQRPIVTIPKAALAFKNQTYQSTDDEDSDSGEVHVRPRSSSDTGLSLDSRREAHLSRSESHKVYSRKEQPKPLVALKRNQKLVGCRRRPAILCLPSKNSSLNDDDEEEEEPRGRRRPPKGPPKCPPSPAPHEKPLRVLPGGWAEFYCSDAGGVGRLYYFHAITGQRSWKPPRTKVGSGEFPHVCDKSDNEWISGRESATGRSSRSPSPAPSDFVLPPGWIEHYDDDEHQNYYVHQHTGAKAQEQQVPGNVADWLHTLRRNTDSSEAEDELKQKVECAAAASGITSAGLAASAARSKSRPPSSRPDKPEVPVKPIMDCSANNESSSQSASAAWKANPLFRGIQPEQIRHSAADQQRRASFKSLCNEARRASKELIDICPGDADKPVHVVVRRDDAALDLDQLAAGALSLADEAIAECIVDKRLKLTRMRTVSIGSDMSDEVFYSLENVEASSIFDKEGSSLTPVAPPRRKKRPIVPESSPAQVNEFVKKMQDLTLKVIEDDLDKKVADNPEAKKIVDAKNVAENKTKEKVSPVKTPPLSGVKVEKVQERVKDKIKSAPKESPEEVSSEKPPIPRPRTGVFNNNTKENEPAKSGRGLQKSISLPKESEHRSKKEPEPEKPPEIYKKSNSLKRAKEYEQKIQKSETAVCKPAKTETVLGVVQRSNSFKKIQEFEQKVQKVEPVKKPTPLEPKAPPPTEKKQAAPLELKSPPPEPKKPPPDQPQVHDPVFAQNFSVQVVERKTFYPEITKDNVVILPVVSQEMKDIMLDELQEESGTPMDTSQVDSLLDGSSLSMSEEQASAEESFRSRKGSNSSDIVAWKSELMKLWSTCDDEDDEVYHSAKQEWFSSSDNEGRLYFFGENSTESTWSLPKTPAAPKSAPPPPDSAPPPRTSTPARGNASAAQGVAPVLRRFEYADDLPAEETESSPQSSLSNSKSKKIMGPCVLPPMPNSRVSKTQSMLVPDIKTPPANSQMDDQPKAFWAIITGSGQTVIKEGVLQRAKIMDGGKKVKKNWATGHVLLTDLRMLFFKDSKNYSLMKDNNTTGQPEMSIELQSAAIHKADKDSSSRKNAFIVSNNMLHVLCQEENIEAADSWFYHISLTINSLSHNHLNTLQRIPISKSREPSPHRGSVSPEANRSGSVHRSKSVKTKKDGSIEDLTAENHTKIKAGLKKFFKRRPTMESLVKKGIWKDEPAFGSYLAKLCADCSPGGNLQVPKFVKACVEAIERNPENLKTDGIYRASGNLSQVQRIRLHVDQNKLSVLDEEEEVHVLTGALKLFFRELKEPLIPFDAFQKAMDANNNKDKREKLRLFRELVQNLPRPNHDTLKYLLEHLLRVTSNQSFNRMHIPNLAIVFGPTLMWPEQESLEMALTLMQQNVVIECLLQEFDSIFK